MPIAYAMMEPALAKLEENIYWVFIRLADVDNYKMLFLKMVLGKREYSLFIVKWSEFAHMERILFSDAYL